jgi:hypothetical protein
MPRKMGKISILLVIVVMLASLTAGCGGVSTPMTLYENTEHGFSIKYPEGWTENVLRPGAWFSIEFTDPEGRLCADVSVEYKTEETTLADAVSEGKAYMEAVPYFELSSEGDTSVGEGMLGYEIVGKGDLGAGKVEKFRYVVLVREKQTFWFGARGEPADFDQQEELIDSIVDSFKLLPTYTFVSPPPSGGGTYTSTEHGFSITYPEGWIEAPTGRPGELVSFASAEGLPSVSINASPVGEGTTLTEFGPQLSQDLGQYWGDYESVSEGEITLDDGTPAYEIVFSGTMEGYTLKGKYVIVIRETQAFFVMGFSTPTRFEQDEGVLNEVIYSFKLLPTYTFEPPPPSGGGTYTSTEHGFSITYPEGWIEAPTGRPGELVSFASAEGLPSVSINASPVGEGTTLAEFGPQLSQDLGQYWGDYELVSEGEITLDDGTPAYEIVFSGTMEGYTLKGKYVIVIRETQAFFVMGFSTPTRFEQDEGVLDEVIYSFHLEWPASEPTTGDEGGPTIAASRLQNPVMLDGKISGNEWEDAGQLSVTFVYAEGGASVTYPGTIYLKHDGTYLWICIRVQDEENRYPEMYDYAAILFDASGDGHIGSGDDSAIIHHGLGPLDLRPDEEEVWRSDTEFGGSSDVAGESKWAAGWYTYEMRKPLNSGDTSGYDIALSPGDTVRSSSCIWDAGEATEWAADAGSFFIVLEP